MPTLLYTGLRRGDAVTLGKQHVKNGLFTISTERSGEMDWICHPALPILAATWKAGPTAPSAFICRKWGEPLTK